MRTACIEVAGAIHVISLLVAETYSLFESSPSHNPNPDPDPKLIPNPDPDPKHRAFVTISPLKLLHSTLTSARNSLIDSRALCDMPF